MDLNERIADNIQALMDRAGFKSQADLSRASGVSRTHISVITRNQKSATTDVLAKLARALGVEPWQLLAPKDMLDASTDHRFKELLLNYLRSGPDGRQTIDRVAESQARYRAD